MASSRRTRSPRAPQPTSASAPRLSPFVVMAWDTCGHAYVHRRGVRAADREGPDAALSEPLEAESQRRTPRGWRPLQLGRLCPTAVRCDGILSPARATVAEARPNRLGGNETGAPDRGARRISPVSDLRTVERAEQVRSVQELGMPQVPAPAEQVRDHLRTFHRAVRAARSSVRDLSHGRSGRPMGTVVDRSRSPVLFGCEGVRALRTRDPVQQLQHGHRVLCGFARAADVGRGLCAALVI